MPLVRAKILCLATYETELDVPDTEIGNLNEYLLDHISEAEMNNLCFYEDIDRDCLLEAHIIKKRKTNTSKSTKL